MYPSIIVFPWTPRKGTVSAVFRDLLFPNPGHLTITVPTNGNHTVIPAPFGLRNLTNQVTLSLNVRKFDRLPNFSFHSRAQTLSTFPSATADDGNSTIQPQRAIRPSRSNVSRIQDHLKANIFHVHAVRVVTRSGMFQPFQRGRLINQSKQFGGSTRERLLFIDYHNSFLSRFRVARDRREVLPGLFVVSFRTIVTVNFRDPRRVIGVNLAQDLHNRGDFRS